MAKLRTGVRAFALLTFLLGLSAAAHAQTRTWVDGVGDDLNPCSRTAPCKTFAKAISATADHGEINVITPGSFGAVTATKSITIDGGSGVIAAITNTNTNGVTVNDSGALTAVVTLRNLTITGATGGTNGVNFVSGKTLNIDHCQITQNTAASPNGAGVRVGLSATTTTGNVTVNIIRSVITHSTSDGVFLDARAFGTVRDSKLAFNGGAGVSLNNGAANSATILGSELHHNSITGLFVGTGTTVRLGGSAVNQNSTNFTNNGTIVSFCNNRSETNPFPGTVTTSCLK